MSWFRRNLLILFVLPALSGCGFSPLYGSLPGQQPVADGLARIAIADIPDRSGQLLRRLLSDRMQAGGAAANAPYLLVVDLREYRIDLGIRKDAVATRARLRYDANYRLIRRRDGAQIFGASARSTASYNILDSEFATTVTAEDAERRGLETLAGDITARLAQFVSRNPQTMAEAGPASQPALR